MGSHSLPQYQTQRSMDQSSAELSGTNVGTGKFSSSEHSMVREGHLSLWFLSFKPHEKQQQEVRTSETKASIRLTNANA